ncbi:Myosin 10A, isoform D [Allomyces arbusculus]|nr:Myosin 10A, isoform D [Allomyces arbusculus]
MDPSPLKRSASESVLAHRLFAPFRSHHERGGSNSSNEDAPSDAHAGRNPSRLRHVDAPDAASDDEGLHVTVPTRPRRGSERTSDSDVEANSSSRGFLRKIKSGLAKSASQFGLGPRRNSSGDVNQNDDAGDHRHGHVGHDDDDFLNQRPPAATRDPAWFAQRWCVLDGSDYNGADEAVDVAHLSPSEVQRQKIIYEVTVTESDYVLDLRLMKQAYMTPLVERGLVTPKELVVLFANLEQLLPIHEELLDLLSKERVKQRCVIANFGTLFSILPQYFKCYSIYGNNYPEALAFLDTLTSTRPAVAKFLAKTASRPACGGMNLASFLLKPIQRLCKYPIMIKEILRYTSADHADYTLLEKSLESMERIVDRVNESRRHAEQQRRLVDMLARLDLPRATGTALSSDLETDLELPGLSVDRRVGAVLRARALPANLQRQLVCTGNVQRVRLAQPWVVLNPGALAVPASPPRGASHLVDRVAVLMSDTLLICKPRAAGLSFTANRNDDAAAKGDLSVRQLIALRRLAAMTVPGSPALEWLGEHRWAKSVDPPVKPTTTVAGFPDTELHLIVSLAPLDEPLGVGIGSRAYAWIVLEFDRAKDLASWRSAISKCVAALQPVVAAAEPHAPSLRRVATEGKSLYSVATSAGSKLGSLRTLKRDLTIDVGGSTAPSPLPQFQGRAVHVVGAMALSTPVQTAFPIGALRPLPPPPLPVAEVLGSAPLTPDDGNGVIKAVREARVRSISTPILLQIENPPVAVVVPHAPVAPRDASGRGRTHTASPNAAGRNRGRTVSPARRKESPVPVPVPVAAVVPAVGKEEETD